ncbi:MAG: 3-phosphoshikimate 1-carboxyvinyltransferase [Candidatus Anoxychlamydiales bacterium]|nr:3-phosphoshikimate 1-carboxyvinyltransferase [Candidatus Anoxychlamydiales bacterium]
MNEVITITMKNYFVKKSTLSGEIIAPTSKSQTMRAILFASLAKGETKIKNFLKTKDTIAFIEGCRKFKAKIKIQKNNLKILGVNRKIDLKKNEKLDVLNSGIALRFFTSIYALADKKILITGDESIQNNRSMKPLIDVLNLTCAEITSIKKKDFAPMEIKGPFKANMIEIDGEDSQHVSSILIASALLKNKIQIKVKNPKEKPWVLMTLGWLDKMGIFYENKNFENFVIDPTKNVRKIFKSFEYEIPTDFSTILFLIVATLITQSEIAIKNVVFDEFQADQKTIEIFQKLGAKIEIDRLNKTISVKKSNLKGNLEIDVDNFIDSVPILAVLGCYNDGTIVLKNALNARKKESDRICTIASELKKMGAKIETKKDGLEVKKSSLKAARVNSYKDHRIAMALTVGALGVLEPSIIEDINCIDKTYPNFKKEFQSLGAHIL